MTPPPELSAVSSVWDLIDTAATQWPAARMFVDDHGRDWTFAAYRDTCLRMAARLSAEGIDATYRR